MQKTIVLLSIIAICIAHVEEREVIETDSKISPRWQKIDLPVDPKRPIKLTIAVKQQNTDNLESQFWSVSDPKSSSFRHFLTLKEITELIAPSDENINQVIDWLSSYGITQYNLHPTRDFLTFSTNVETAERLLATQYKDYFHPNSGKTFLKAVGGYSVPKNIADKIDFISGFRLPNYNSKFKRSNELVHRSSDHLPKELPEGNSPILAYINPLDQIAITTILPRCENGSVTSSLSLCSDRGNSILQFNVYVNQSRSGLSTFQIGVNGLKCSQCDEAEGHMLNACLDTNMIYNLPNDTVYCDLPVQPLPDYEQLIFGYGTKFSDNSNTAVAYYPELSVWLSKFVTPQELTNLYGIPKGTVGISPLSSQSVAEFLGQYYSPNDLSQFFNLMGIRAAPVSVIGPNNDTQPGGEATLDIEYIMGVAPNITTVFWSLGELHDGQEPFLDWITDVLNDPNSPYIHSISYGDDEDSLSSDYMYRVNIEFIKAGIYDWGTHGYQGDSGVYGGGGPPSLVCENFVPSFPPTSPYVTAVGATLFSTQVLPICEQSFYGFNIPCHIIGETVSSTAMGSRITSGGGFSNIFGRPSYQDSEVLPYAFSLDIPSQYYNYSGRAYPDIAAIGHNYLVVLGGEIVPIDGTSAATPVAAAIFTLLNDFQLRTNGGPLGFLNPWLYGLAQTNATAFNDILTGDNSCSELASVCCEYGFPAALGYDAVTGLGSVNYNTLLEILMGL